MKIGILITEDSEAWSQESVGKYFLERFSQNSDVNVIFEIIYAITGKLPEEEDIAYFDGFVISGSHYSVNDDLKWIRNLEEFIRTICGIPEEKRPRLFGICFGHQLIAKALGGEVGRNIHGKYIFGAEIINLHSNLFNDEYFTKVFQEDHKAKQSFKIMQSHGEEIIKLPKQTVSVGVSGTCNHEVLKYGKHILSTQGHPEFLEHKMKQIILPRLQKNNKLNEKESEASIKSFVNADTDRMVQLVLSFLLH